MKRMRWSWVEYCALPSSYYNPLLKMLKKEDAANRKHSRT
jgi:hypothetical protein